MQDTVFIEGLKVDTVIGIYDWERTIEQRLVFDLEMFHDQHAAARGDSINNTLDYEAISNRVVAFVNDDRGELIETVAERVAAMLLAEFAIARLTLTLRKPGAVPAADAVGVRIHRGSRIGTAEAGETHHE